MNDELGYHLLKIAIQHWELKVLYPNNWDINYLYCPLCYAFNNCIGCPVKEYKESCHAIGYYEWTSQLHAFLKNPESKEEEKKLSERAKIVLDNLIEIKHEMSNLHYDRT